MYLCVLALPPFRGVRWIGVPVVLATGLVAGVAAGLLSVNHPDPGYRCGLVSGSVVGAGFAGSFWVALNPTIPPSPPPGVFYDLNYLLATNARYIPIARHDRLVVAVLACAGGVIIALLGAYAGRAAPRRTGTRLLEW